MDTHRNGMTAEEIRDLVGDGPTMCEVGAHAGIDTVKFLAAMPNLRIYCFEPDTRPFARLKEAVGGDSRVSLYPFAVAEIDGEKPFYASTGKAGHMDDWDYSGSLHEPTGHYERSPEIAFKEPVQVQCLRLDTWLGMRPLLEVIDFAWCDVQAGQTNLIAGGRMAFALTRYVYLEVHSTPLYEGEPSLREVIKMLPGFEPLAVYGGENLLLRNLHILQ